MFFNGIDICFGNFHLEYQGTHSHFATYYGIQYNHAGKVRLRVNHGDEFQGEGACAFVTYPGTFFEYGSVDGLPRQHYHICFLGDRVRQYIESGLFPIRQENLLIKINYPDKFRHSLIELIKAQKSHVFQQDRMTLMLEDLLLQLHEQNPPQKKLPAWQSEYFVQLMTEIRENPQKKWDFVKEAARINVTTVHYRRLFKKFCNAPPNQYVLLQRLRLASELLLNNNASVGNIAAEVGIEDIYYFSRAFKKQFMVSPLGYRKEFLGK